MVWLSQGPEYFLDELKGIWDETPGEGVESRPDFHFVQVDFTPEVSFCLLEMPPPERLGEPFFVGLLFGPRTSPRYFLYVLGHSPTEGEECQAPFLFCEWTQDGEMRNYGSFANPKMSFFTSQIQEKLQQEETKDIEKNERGKE